MPPAPGEEEAPQLDEAVEETRPCELTEGEDRACDDEAAKWATGQVVRLVALYAAPVGIGVLGLWSLALAALASLAAWRLYRGVLTRDR